MVMLRIKLKKMPHAATWYRDKFSTQGVGLSIFAPCKHIFCPYTHPRPLGSDQMIKTLFFLKSHVAYQIKDYGAQSITQAHILFLHTPSVPRVGLKVKTVFISASSHVEYQVKVNGT